MLPYFTVEGKDTLEIVKNTLNIQSDYNLDLLLSLIGKSNLDKELKDRIYMQFKIVSNSLGIDETINIVARLNSNLKVFDVDIL